jgi:hypothetical protein
MRRAHSMLEFAKVAGTRTKVLLLSAVLLLVAATALRAQDDEQKGIDQGNYNIKQSIEFGGRITSISGDVQAYDTFVNLQQGPRLLGFTTEMASLDHRATLFDRLYFSNFGYGGDPNDVSRLRISKNRWYNFDAMFRRDENFWDYSVFANPLNPVTLPANAPANFNPQINAPSNVLNTSIIGISPHLFATQRKLGDYNLVLLPDSKIRFRVGYSRNITEGPGLSSIHQGTEQELFEDYKATVNTYRLGVDFRILPRTNISYDQIFSYYKGDTGTTDMNQQFPVGTGLPLVDLGVSFNPPASQPCGGTFTATGLVNPTCSAYYNYFDHGRTRTNVPTEQLSLQSNYFTNWDFSARVSYSGGDSDVFGYNQGFFGLESRTATQHSSVTGPVHNRRVAGNADFGITWHITKKLSFVDSFHYLNWHDPGEFDANNCAFFSANLITPTAVFTPTATPPVNCTAPAGTVVGTPFHSGSSGPDASVVVNSNFLKQDEKTNLAELAYQFSDKLGARIGFRYRHRYIADNFYSAVDEVFYPGPTPANAARGDCARLDPTAPVSPGNLPSGCTLNSDNSISSTSNSGFSPASASVPPINEYAGVFGIWARPTRNWKISFDMDLMSADGSFTRISPTHSQEYRVRSKYKVTDWLSVNGNVLIWEGRNDEFQQGDLQHNRAYGVSVLLQPSDKLGLEIGYDYNDVFSQVLICYISVVAGQPGPGIQACPDVPGLVQQLSTYKNNSNYGFLEVSYAPLRRLTVHLGANLTGTSGSELRLDPQALIPNAVTGPLNSKWLHPYGGLDYHFAKGWTGKAYWDYYGYHEDPTAGAVQDTFAPRNFRANNVTLSVRYAF